MSYGLKGSLGIALLTPYSSCSAGAGPGPAMFQSPNGLVSEGLQLGISDAHQGQSAFQLNLYQHLGSGLIAAM